MYLIRENYHSIIKMIKLQWNKVNVWGQLFKTNDIVSYRFVKIYIEWYANMLKLFAEKMWVAFGVQKLFTFFQQKISEYCILNPLKQLTEWH